MTDKNSTSDNVSRGTSSVIPRKDIMTLNNKKSNKPTRQALKNRPYEVFKFKAKSMTGVGQKAKIKKKIFSFPMPEVQNILNEIGYDMEQDDNQYFWFLKRILVQDLPKGWVKETSMMGEAYYHNTVFNITTTKHPYIKHYRRLFNQILSNKKMIQQQVEQDLDLNRQQDKEPNKQGRATFIAPDKMEQPSNQEQKIIEQKVYGESEIIDLKNFLNELSQASDQKFRKLSEIQSLVNALGFYERLIDLNVKKPPTFLKNHPDYLKINPDDLIRLGLKYKLDLRFELDLLWIVRLVNCLPMPPFWLKVINDQVTEGPEYRQPVVYYKDLETGAKFNFHPCSLFIIKLINKNRLDQINAGVYKGDEIKAKQQKRRANQPYSQRVNQYQNQAALTFKFMDHLNRIYKCSGKDLFDLAYDQLNLDNRSLEEIFEVESEPIQTEFQLLQQVFQRQVSTYIHEKQMTDAEIRAVADQCKLQAHRETYLYKSVYEFLAQKYQEQEDIVKEYESKLQNKNGDVPVQLPQVWIFRQTLEGHYYWIEKNSKEISKVYPFLKDARKFIEEIKVTNTAIEQYVSSNSQVKVLKKVENYLKLKSYSTAYIAKLIQININQEQQQKEESEEEQEQIEGFQPEDFLDQIKKDLDIEEEISKEELMQWMFAWPYELSDEFFNQREQIQKKIEEDLNLIREKSRIRKETLNRMIKKITVINRLGKLFGGVQMKPPRQNQFAEQMMRRIQEEELLQKIKKTKALVGVSDIRIKKKLRILLQKAMQDDSEKEKLLELEQLEKELLESKQKNKKAKLKEKLKHQLGLDDSGLDEEDEEDDQSIINPGMDGPNFSQNQISESDNEEDDESNEDDEPADDSFTFKGTQVQKKEDDDDDDEDYDQDYEQENAQFDEQNQNDDITPTKIQQSQIPQINRPLILQETLEQRRKRLENMMLQNKIKELIESTAFVKRIRRKLRLMNISKTQEDLKKKIIFLKMMQLRVAEDQQLIGEGHDAKDLDKLDFLYEALHFQEEQSSTDQSFSDESSVSIMIDKIDEVDSDLEVDNPLREAQHEEDSKIQDVKSSSPSSAKKSLQKVKSAMSENQFYDEFSEIKAIERILSRKNTIFQSPLKVNSGSRKTSMAGELIEESDLEFKALSSRKSSIKKRSNIVSRHSSFKEEGIVIGDSRLSKRSSKSPLRSSDRLSPVKSSLPHSPVHPEIKEVENEDQQHEKVEDFLIKQQQENNHLNKEDSPSFDTMREVTLNLGKRPSPPRRATSMEISGSPQSDSPLGIIKIEPQPLPPHNSSKGFHTLGFFNKDLNIPKTRRQTVLQIVDETKNDSESRAQSPLKPSPGRLSVFEIKKRDSRASLFMFREITKASQEPQQQQQDQQKPAPVLEPTQEDPEFARFLAKIKVFENEPDEIDINQLDGYGQFILQYYFKSIGQPQLPKDQLKICTKYSQSLNIDSILFTAQKLSIKVLAQRETDLLWIAQEYLVHPGPPINDFQGDKTNGGLATGESVIEKIKTHYFRQLVKEQRKLRVEHIKNILKDSDDLEKYMRDNSWVIICEKQEFYRYNYQTKEKDHLNINMNQLELQRRLSSDANSNQILQNQMGSTLLSFFKKRGLLQVKSSQNVQMSQPLINQKDAFPINQAQYNSNQANAQMSFQELRSNDTFSIQKQGSYKIGVINLGGLNSDKESDQLFFSPWRESLDDYKTAADFKTANQIITSRPSQPQPYYYSQLSFNNHQMYNTFDSQKERMSSQQSSHRQSSQRQLLLQKEKGQDNTPRGNKLSGYQGSDSNYQANQSQTSKFAPKNRQSGSIPKQNIAPIQEQEKPIRNIKRIILNNNHENFARLQMKKLEEHHEHFHQNGKFKEPTPCLKFLDKHLQSTIKSPSEDMHETLQQSSNFNTMILKNMQEKIKLRSVSYLTQERFQQNIIQEQQELEYEKEVFLSKLEFAQSLATTLPFHYKKLLSENETLPYKPPSSSRGFKHVDYEASQTLKAVKSLPQIQPLTQRDTYSATHTHNDFRNMSPKSLKRYAQKTELSYGFAKRMGLLKQSVGTQNYGKLGRLQEDKMVFTQIINK